MSDGDLVTVLAVVFSLGIGCGLIISDISTPDIQYNEMKAFYNAAVKKDNDLIRKTREYIDQVNKYLDEVDK